MLTSVLILITSLTGIVTPMLNRLFIDDVLTGQKSDSIRVFFFGTIAVTAVNTIASLLQAKYMCSMRARMAAEGHTGYIKHLLKLPMEFFSQRSAGELKNRAAMNENMAGDFVNVLAPLSLQTLFLAIYAYVLYRQDPLLSLVSLISIVINVCVGALISQKLSGISAARMMDEEKAKSYAYYGISMIETIKSGGAGDSVFEKWARINNDVLKEKNQGRIINSTLGAIPDLLMLLTTVAVVLLGVNECAKGNMTTGKLLAFQGILVGMYGPLNQLISSLTSIKEMDSRAKRISDVMEYPEDDIIAEDAEDTKPEKLTGTLELSHVTFGYSPLASPLINDFSMKVEQGRSVAIVGGSGSGKSTLAKLMSGLYRPWEGNITIGGRSIYEIDKSSFKGTLTVVDQDIMLFEDTIENNIKMWDSTIEDYEMILAARDAQIHDDILERNQAYRYVLAEGGKDFSGGQRQRIEIARALALDPHILIMDEATSALDALVEREVVRAIKRRGITLVIVAHRLSTIRDCDEIIVLDHGNIVERGNHEELMALKGAYHELVCSD